MAHRPWLVASSGRTGSSTVARLLHEEMGISMGDKFPDADKFNTKGYYEDEQFYVLDDALYSTGTMNPYHHQGLLAGFINQRIERGTPWGIKNPWMQYSIGQYIENIREFGGVDPIIIRSHRPLHWVIKSLQKMKPESWGQNTRNAYVEYVGRTLVFDYQMKAYPEIKVHNFWFRRRDVPDSEVLAWLKAVQEEENGKQEDN